MVEKSIKEKDLIDFLRERGFKEIKAAGNDKEWYKKASEQPLCLKAVQKNKVKI